MKILHVTESHEAAAGGVTTVVDQLLRLLSGAGHQAVVVAIGREPIPVPPNVELIAIPPRGLGRPWGASPDLATRMRQLVDRTCPDLIHIHGAWMAAQWHAARLSHARQIPSIVSFHGMLEPENWAVRGLGQLLRKRCYWSLLGRPAFRRVSVLHAVTASERRNLGALLGRADAVVIPNAIASDCLPMGSAPMGVAGAPRRVLGFLGRMHPIKGVDLLVRAFSRARISSDWTLELAGPPQEGRYVAELEALAAAGSAGRIRWIGPLYGEAKERYFRSLWALIVPSRSEVIGMVNLESVAAGTPTVTTRATGLDDWAGAGGVLVDAQESALAAAIEEVCGWDADARARSVEGLQALVQRRYTWSAVGPQWLDLYARTAGR